MVSATGTAANGLCVSAALLYAGIFLLLDPERVARLAEDLAGRLRDFDLALRGYPALNRLAQPPQADVSQPALFRIRVTGLVFIAVAFLMFALVCWQYR